WTRAKLSPETLGKKCNVEHIRRRVEIQRPTFNIQHRASNIALWTEAELRLSSRAPLRLVPRVPLTPDAGQFFARRYVDDFELFGVQGRLFAEVQLAEIAFLYFDQVLLILGPQAIEDGRMHDDEQLEVGFFARTFLENFIQLTLDFNAHGQGALDLAAALAIRAVVIDGSVDALGVAL